MSKNYNYTGKHVEAFLSDKVDRNEDFSLDEIIDRKPHEAVYVYNFKENKAEYIKGYKILGLKDEDLNIIKLNELFAPKFKDFVNEYHDRILLEIYNDKEALDTFSSKIIVRVNDFDYPVMVNIQVLKTDENGNLLAIIGRNTTSPKLATTDVVQFSFNGKFSDDVLFEINHNLNFTNSVSEKMIRILEGIEKGNSFNTIARTVKYKATQVEMLINKFKDNFGLANTDDILKFAKENYLLPNQFKAHRH